MKTATLYSRFIAFGFGVLLSLLTGAVYAKNLLYTPDGRVVQLKGGAMQPDLSMYRSTLQSKVADRRFYTNDATYMANEAFKFGMEGFVDLVKASMPVAYHRSFQWVTFKEMYFYARYLLDYIGGRGHAGVHMVHGPYWTLQQQRLSHYNRIQRDRGEREFSNKDVMLGFFLPLVYQRTGFPRVFDDVQLTYLQYKSVDPHFIGNVDGADSFEDAMSGKKGGWGQPNSYLNDYEQRFDHDGMDTTFNMGAIGQFLKRRMQWADYFFHSDHKEVSPVSLGTEVPMLGNDAEEGMRGWGLAMGGTNTLLEVKSSMFTDGKSLMGIDPSRYDPAKGLRYIPHEIEPNILYVGDAPERVWATSIKDASSQLWDQASWVWGVTAYATTVNRRTKLFTDNPPVDGGLLEKSLGTVAEAMTNAVFKNIEAMHMNKGILVSSWTPEKGVGDRVSLRDMAMTLVALHDMEQGWETLDRYPEITERVRKALEDNARFLLKVQGKDGAFYGAYSVPSGKPLGNNTGSEANFAAARALLAAYFTTENEEFLAAARKTFNLLNREYWVENQGVYRTKLGDDTVVVTPYTVGIELAAMREMLLATPTYMADAQIERATRWWIQTVDQSGMIQSENHRTGEIYTGLVATDDDADGIPYTSRGDGENGIAPVFASRVLINVGGGDNQAFGNAPGDLHDVNRYARVRMSYKPAPRLAQLKIILPLTNPKSDGLVEREPMERGDGTIIPLQPSKPIKVGLGTVLGLTGRQIFEHNCSACHGQFGEGIDGLPLEKDMNRTHDAMFKIVNSGRFAKFMPPWGTGNEDGFGGTLTKVEIDKVVDYVQSEPFKKKYQMIQADQVPKDSLPRDVWFYLSRENVKAHGTKISGSEDARRWFALHPDPAKIKADPTENIARNKPDADLKLADRNVLKNQLGLNRRNSKLAQNQQ